jgi:uncharacterized repeat protein (TIGR03803 family)
MPKQSSTAILLLVLSTSQALRAAGRITLSVDDNRRATLPGHVNPRLKSAIDQGPVDPSMQLPYVSLVLKPSPSQRAGLEQLLAGQQDPKSPNYHVWVTPEQYADRFGVGQPDIDKIVAWLAGHGLAVKSVARGRNTIAFGGAAAAIEGAFGIGIHRYQAGGEAHYANTADPSIPVAFQPVVLAIQGLTDFRLKPMLQRSLHPRDNFDNVHVLAPDDIATIYDIAPLFKAGIDGTGQNLAVVGQAVVAMSDIQAYRSHFNLPANNPAAMLVPGSQSPGGSQTQNDLAEADLDLELSGAVARNANILFIYSWNAIDAFQYAIDQNLAPVISISYGSCELQTPLSEVLSLETWGTHGAVYELTPPAILGDGWTFTGVYDFTGPPSDGGFSLAPLTVGVGGVLYGTTFIGGPGTPCSFEPYYTSGCGTVFQLTPPVAAGGAWTESVLYSFTGSADGAYPTASVVLGANGVLYGTTEYGGVTAGSPCSYYGATGCGTVFQLTPPAAPGGPWTETVLHSFTGQNGDGSLPTAGLVLSTKGLLYGMTSAGGSVGDGTVFAIKP